jgi:hypothetical protein
MVRIKHTAHPKVLPKTASMVSGDEMEVPSQRREVLPNISSSWSLDDSGECKSRSGGSGDTTSDSNGSSHMKVVVVAATAGITYDFRLSAVGKERITSLEIYALYFP